MAIEIEQKEAIVASLPASTGVTLREWVGLVDLLCGARRPNERIHWLVDRYGLDRDQAKVIVAGAAPKMRSSERASRRSSQTSLSR